MSSASTSARSGSGNAPKPAGPPGYGGSGSRKSKGDRVNLDHLLNFTMPPRELTRGPGSGVPRRSRRGNLGSSSKEKYVNSQFRFVMKPTENYAAHFADPDLFFQWSNILQVLAPTISALSIAQGDEPASSSSTAANSHSAGPSRSGGGQVGRDRSDDAERRLRREKEKEGLTCPICLDKPVAGRMTRCGHIFCFPCILHYFQLSDIPRSAKCPICGDTIESKLLKSIKWWDGEPGSLDVPMEFNEAGASGSHPNGFDHHEHQHDSVLGELSEFDSASQSSPHRLRMRLIQRPQITTLALPRSTTWPSEALPQHQAPWHFLPDVMSFSKFMIATEGYMIDELQRDLAELDKELENLGPDELGKSFVEAAVRQVLAQMDKARVELDTPVLRKSEREARSAMQEVQRVKRQEILEAVARKEWEAERARQETEVAGRVAAGEHKEHANSPDMVVLGDVPIEYLQAIGQGGLVNSSLALPRPVVEGISDAPPSAPPTASPSGPARNKARKTTLTAPRAFSVDDPSYLYYQAASGTHIYLHPLDIKILISHFKSYNAFPEYITVRPEGADGGSINDDLRRRCKYLAHLQMGTDVVFMEADLEEVVGAKAVESFDQALKQRRSRRRDKVKKDDRAKARWEAKEREKLPLGMRNMPMPAGDLDDDFLVALQRSTMEVHGRDGFPSTSPSTSFLSTTSYPPGLSASASNSRISPAQGDIVSTPSTSPAPGAGVWGSSSGRSFASALHSTSPTLRMGLDYRTQEVDPGVDEAWLEFERSAAALAQTKARGKSDTAEQDAGAAEGSAGGGKGGKKKAKKIVLNMSGGGGRRG